MALEGYPGITATVRDYGRYRHRLVAVAEAWLGVPEGSLVRPAVGQLNRSLTPEEAILLSAVKARMAPPYPDLGWSLVVQAPELPARIQWPSRELQEEIHLLVRDSLEALNRFLPPEESLSFEFREPSPPMEEAVFSGRQLAAIGPELSHGWDGLASRASGVAWLRRQMGDARGSSIGISKPDGFSIQIVEAEGMRGSIDRFGDASPEGRCFRVSGQGVVTGWAVVDPGRGWVGDAVFLFWEAPDGRARLHGCRPVRRPDVAAALGREGLIWAGFETMHPLDAGAASGHLHLWVCHGGTMYRNASLVWELQPAV
jgi:hypothetical protein